MIRRLIAAILLALLAVAPALAADGAGGPEAVRRAAESGNAEAQLNLGILYQYGFHLKGSRIDALAWYIVAADNGLVKAVAYREKLIHELTPAEVAQARAEAKKIAKTIHKQPQPTEAAPGTGQPSTTAPLPMAPSGPTVPEAQSAPSVPETPSVPMVPEAQSVPLVPQTQSLPSDSSGDSDSSAPVPTVQTAPAP